MGHVVRDAAMLVSLSSKRLSLSRFSLFRSLRSAV
jgi:hypothetical protein